MRFFMSDIKFNTLNHQSLVLNDSPFNIKKWSVKYIDFIPIVSATWKGKESLVISISRLFIEFKKII